MTIRYPDDAPQWAYDRAIALSNEAYDSVVGASAPTYIKGMWLYPGDNSSTRALARYIAEHEKDEVLLQARKIVADAHREQGGHKQAESVIAGNHDNYVIIKAVTAALRLNK